MKPVLNKLHSMALLSLASLATACFSPNYGDPAFTCGDNAACPGGYVCLGDNLCHLGGANLPDASQIDSAPGPDADRTDSPPLPDAATPPDNDVCSNAQPLVCGAGQVGSFANATDTADYSCSGTLRPDVYYTFSIGTNQDVTVSLGSTFDTGLTLLSFDCSSEVECRNDTILGEVIQIENLAAGTYVIAAEALNGGGGSFTIDCATSAATVRPTNNTCTGPITLQDGVPLSNQNAVNATDDVSTACSPGGNGDVAYTFTIPPGPNRRAKVTVSGAVGFDPILTLRQGGCPGTEMDCANFRDDASEILDATNLPPGTYTVWVDLLGGSPSQFDIRLDLLGAVAPPGNDQCSAANVLTANTVVTGSTIGAADDYDLACLPLDSKDTVHRFTTTGAAAVLVSIEPTPPWALAASLRTTANCTNTTDISCVDGAFATRFFNRPNLGAGTYDVIVDGVAGDVGNYSIVYSTRPVDSTFGYWEIRTTKPYQNLSSFTNVPVPSGITEPDNNFPLTIPFSFPFFGNTYTQLIASDNGFVTFGADPLNPWRYNNDCPLDATTPLDMIALFWDDHYSDGAARLRHRVDGTAPYRTFTIEYRDWDILESNCGVCVNPTGSRVSQQLVLHENGDVAMHYGPRTAPTAIVDCQNQHLGCSASIGLRNAVGTDIDEAQCNVATLTDGTYIYYVAPR